MDRKLGLTDVSILFVLATLAACGGGGDGGGSTAAPTNNPAAAPPANNGGRAGSGATPKAWRTAALVETENAGAAQRPQIAIDANGNALAVWYQFGGARADIWANRYTASTGWGTAALIETNNAGNALWPQIAIDTNGNALAVWQQSDGNSAHFDIWSNRYTAGTGWGTAVLIETDNADGAGWPQIAIDANGNALAVWGQWDGMRENIWSNRYTAGTGWGTAALIETDNAGGASSAQIAINANGNALAVWEQFDGTRFNIWANSFQ